MKHVLLVLILLAWAPVSPASNVLFVLFDDVGCPKMQMYTSATNAVRTPVMLALAEQGVTFDHAYSQPVCSPTRVCVQTGVASWRLGIGRTVDWQSQQWSLKLQTVTLPERLAVAGVTCGLAGKWHMSSLADGGIDAPNLQGWADARFNPANIDQTAGWNYYHWQRVVNGVDGSSDTYVTSAQVDDAIDLMNSLPEPFVVFLCFNAPHSPSWELGNTPPPELTDYDLSNHAPFNLYAAALNAADTELGRLLASVDAGRRSRTTIFVSADNGTPKPVALPPENPNRVKGTVYEGGVHVPLFVWGEAVRKPGRCAALVQLTDIHATILEINRVTPAEPLDSISLVPYLSDPCADSIRRSATADYYAPNNRGGYSECQTWDRMIRSDRWKIVWHSGAAEFYDLFADPSESTNLLAGPLSRSQKIAYDALSTEAEKDWGRP